MPLLLFGPQDELTGAHLNLNRSCLGDTKAELVIPLTVCGELEGSMVGVVALDRIGAAHLRFVEDAHSDTLTKVQCVPVHAG